MSELSERLERQGLTPTYEGKQIGDVRVIDPDTYVVDGKEIRATGIDAPEVSHYDPLTLQQSTEDVHGVATQRRVEDIIEKEGFTTPVTTGKRGYYQRELGTLTDDEGRGLSERLLYSGVADPSTYASDYHLSVAAVGDLDRAQRAAEGNQTEDDLFIRSKQLRNQRLNEYGLPLVKPLAASAKVYAANPGAYSGVVYEQRDRSLLNEIKGFQLDDAWKAGKGNAMTGIYNSIGIIGELADIDKIADYGYGNASRVKRELQDSPQLRNTTMFDPETGEYTIDGFVGFTDWLSVNIAQSLPIMGATILSAAAAIPTYGASLSIPVSLYTGLNYDGQEEGEKDIGKAFRYGVLQAGLDLIGVKIGGKAVSNFFTSQGARKEVIEQISKQTGKSAKESERVLVGALKGQFDDAVKITQDQLDKAKLSGGRAGAGLGLTVGADSLAEGGTEALQEYFSVIAENQLDKITPEQLQNRLLNALAAGTVIGGTFSAAGEVPGAFSQGNYNAGLKEASTPPKDNYSHDIDIQDSHKDLSNEEAFDWVQGQAVKGTDNLEHLSLKERGEQKVEGGKGYIDRSVKGVGKLLGQQVEQGLGFLRGRGPIADRFIAPFLGNRSGATLEESKQLASSRIAGKQLFDEQIAISATGFGSLQAFSEYHYDAERSKHVDVLLDSAIRTGKSVKETLLNYNNRNKRKNNNVTEVTLDPGYITFLDQVVEGSREGNQEVYGDPQGGSFGATVNILERGFSPHAIYSNHKEFVEDLVNYKGINRQDAEKISSLLSNTEELANPSDLSDPLLNILDGANLNQYGKAIRGLKEDARFSKYLENNPFNNIAQNANRVASKAVNNKFLGENASKIEKGISDMVKSGEITQDESIELAKFFTKYINQLNGVDNVITNRTYNAALNFGTTLAATNHLSLAAISSLPETVTALFHNNPKPLKTLGKAAKVAADELLTLSTELGNRLSRGHIPVKEFGDHRSTLRELGYLADRAAPAARVGAEYSPRQARFMQTFFQFSLLNSLTNIQRAMRLAVADDAVNSFVAQAALHYPTTGKPNKHYKNAIEQLNRLGIPGERVALLAYSNNVVKDQGGTIDPELVQKELDNYADIARVRFVDTAIVMPRKGNRPAFYSDPRYRIFTTFQGYNSTATANLLPQIFANLGGRDKLPAQRVAAIETIVGMLVIAGLGISLKESIKGREDDEEPYNSRDFLRTMYASGLVGTPERVISQIFPVYNPSSTLGDAIGKNVSQPFGDLVDLAIGEAPIISNIDNASLRGFQSLLDEKDPNAARNFIGQFPVVSTILKERYFGYEERGK